MNTDHKKNSPNRLANIVLRHRWSQLLALLVVIVAVWIVISILRPKQESQDNGITVPVSRGPLRISVTESGTIKSRDQVVVKNQVEGRTTILTLIPEGTYVKKGDLLIELDASSLQDQKTKQEITVLNANASFIRANENLAVTKSQGESDVAEANLDYEFAKLDLQKYLEGEYPQELRQLQAEITIAEQELTQTNDTLEWSRKLAKEGYITETELKGDELDATRKQLNLELARGKLDLLQTYTQRRNLEQLKSDVEQAEKSLERVQRRARADDIQAEADLRAKESEYNRQESILTKTNDQIAKCRIIAPVGGMVVYATTGQGTFRGNVEPLDEGQEVRERQELIHLPTTSSMMAEIKVHESSLRKIQSNMPVNITVDALPGKVFSGRVGKIGLLPDAQSAWLNPDLKVFSTEIYLDGDASEIRPGMSCRAEIIVEEYSDTFYVPVQSVLRVGGVPTAYVVGPKGVEPRAVELGLDNNRMVRIVSGLKEGEQVLLNPPLSPSTVTNQSNNQNGKPAASPQQPEAVSNPVAPPAVSQTPDKEQPTISSQFDPEKLKSMSAEERRKLFENLTPEQQEQLQQIGRQPRESGQDRPANGPTENR